MGWAGWAFLARTATDVRVDGVALGPFVSVVVVIPEAGAPEMNACEVAARSVAARIA